MQTFPGYKGGIVATARAFFYGLLVAVAVFGVHGLAHSGLSPFSATALVLFGIMVCAVSTGVPKMWKGSLLRRSTLQHCFVTSILVFVSLLAKVLGLFLGADPLTAIALIGLSFPLRLLGRKIFWGEGLSRVEKVFLLGIVSLLPFVLLGKSSIRGFSSAMTVLGNIVFLLGTLLWNALSVLMRPQVIRTNLATYWAWVCIFSAAVGLPILMIFQRGLIHASLQHEVLGTDSFAGRPLAILLLVVFGVVLAFMRIFYFAESRHFLSGQQLSLLSTLSATIAGVCLSCFGLKGALSISQVVVVAMFIVLLGGLAFLVSYKEHRVRRMRYGALTGAPLLKDVDNALPLSVLSVPHS